MTPDNTPSFIFVQCPECLKKQRAGLHAKMLTKFPAQRELTADEIRLMEEQARGYVQELSNMCSSHRKVLKVSASRLPGEVKLGPDALMDLGRVRSEACWLLDVHTSKPRDGAVTVDMQIYRDGEECPVH